MGLFNIIPPCVIEGRHHVRAVVAECDDTGAAPYVESGALTPFRAGGFVEKIEPGAFKAALAASRWVSSLPEHAATEDVSESEPEVEQPKPRRRRKTVDDGETD